MYLVSWPDRRNERNAVQALAVPEPALEPGRHYDPAARGEGPQGLPAAERPPVLPVFLSFRAMVGLGVLFLAVAVWSRCRSATRYRALPLLPARRWRG